VKEYCKKVTHSLVGSCDIGYPKFISEKSSTTPEDDGDHKGPWLVPAIPQSFLLLKSII